MFTFIGNEGGECGGHGHLHIQREGGGLKSNKHEGYNDGPFQMKIIVHQHEGYFKMKNCRSAQNFPKRADLEMDLLGQCFHG